MEDSSHPPETVATQSLLTTTAAAADSLTQTPQIQEPSVRGLQAPALPGSRQFAKLAPWYHTLGIVLLLMMYAFVAHLTHHHTADPSADTSRVEQTVTETAHTFAQTPKVPLYLSTIMLSWMLLASVVAGLYRRRAFFLGTLRRRFASRWIDPALGGAIYVSFLTTVSALVLLITAILVVSSRHAHPFHTAGPAQTQAAAVGGSDAASATAEEVEAAQQRVQRMLHVNHGAVASLAPQTLPELLLWIALSFTAGFCEEHIFRGYLLQQSLAFLQRFALPSWFAAALSVLATSALFGSLHLYEGSGGAIIVGLLGAVLATTTLVLGNLRAVIIAHFLQDLFGGLVYYIAHVRHVT